MSIKLLSRIGFCAVAALTAGCAPQDEAPPPTTTTQPAGPVELRVSMTSELDAPAAEVWEVVGNFGAIADYVEVVSTIEMHGEGVGARRVLHLEDGNSVVETLQALDAEAMTLSYTIDESPLPVEAYTGTMKVTALDDGRAQLEWSSTFMAKGASDDDAKAAISGIYQMGFDGLVTELEPDEDEEEAAGAN